MGAFVAVEEPNPTPKSSPPLELECEADGQTGLMPNEKSRMLRFAIVSAIILVSGQSLQGQANSDEAALRNLIAAHEKASAENDLRGLVDVYSPDAEMISGSGNVVRGREAIEAYYRQQLASASARSGRHHTHPSEAIRIRFVTADVALVDLPSRSVGGVNAEDPLAPPLPRASGTQSRCRPLSATGECRARACRDSSPGTRKTALDWRSSYP